MLANAFDSMGMVRVQLKCDARNVPSMRAIEKLGAVHEGVLRRHMIMGDGFVRDTVMYSITEAEWPTVRDRLHARIGG
jgi:aminoglycoside 6'-N-acetyltransferase